MQGKTSCHTPRFTFSRLLLASGEQRPPLRGVNSLSRGGNEAGRKWELRDSGTERVNHATGSRKYKTYKIQNSA
ncbi:hypothetical protein BaRGS_00031410 [Batillaria attramentaria]|uniref:Uncharacterized protein n=1 Tax=Batillaria attramentaria TaxID=370345 RepID=A0ABD0JRN7_9CAEN